MSDYSDPSDRATLEEEREIELRIALVKQESGRRALQPIGKCHSCYEPFPDGKADPRLFCDGDCATDHERIMRSQQQRGRWEDDGE